MIHPDWRYDPKEAIEKRIGCDGCDWVGSISPVHTETELHGVLCPNCGEQNLHHYPVFGTWPSDYDEPPCTPPTSG